MPSPQPLASTYESTPLHSNIVDTPPRCCPPIRHVVELRHIDKHIDPLDVAPPIRHVIRLRRINLESFASARMLSVNRNSSLPHFFTQTEDIFTLLFFLERLRIRAEFVRNQSVSVLVAGNHRLAGTHICGVIRRTTTHSRHKGQPQHPQANDSSMQVKLECIDGAHK